MTRSFARLSAVSLAAATVCLSTSANGYVVNDNWCDWDVLRWGMYPVEFDNRGLSSANVEADMKIAASWWWEVQANIGFGGRQDLDTFPPYLPPPQGAPPFTYTNPGQMTAACQNEYQVFINSPGTAAWTAWNYWWHP